MSSSLDSFETVVISLAFFEDALFEDVSLEDAFSRHAFLEDDVISLASFEDEQSFETLKELILRVNEHADARDYAIVLARIKKFKHDEKRKT